jgi:hypothetical protein
MMILHIIHEYISNYYKTGDTASLVMMVIKFDTAVRCVLYVYTLLTGRIGGL